MRFLRQSTQADIVIGPVWSTSDYTYKTDLAYNASGIDCNVNKSGAGKTDVTLANSAGDGYFRADVNGYYLLTLSTSLTDTVGRFRVSLQATGYAMAPIDYTVLSGAVYDALFGSTALSTLAQADIRTATGLASANLDTQFTNNLAKYVHGSVWIDTVNGASGTTAYVNGIPSNPSSTLAAAKTIGDNLKLKRFWVQAGSVLAANADCPGYVFDGRGYTLSVNGARDISKVQIDRCESLSMTGATCATGEAVIRDCHLLAITIGEADFFGCHLNDTVTLSQASVPYLFAGCTGVGTLAKIVMNAASQSLVVSKWSGALTIAGMAAGKTAWIDGDGELTLDATCTGGTVYVAGNVTLTNLGTGMTIVDTSRYGEEQNVYDVTHAVPQVTLTSAYDNAKADVLTPLATVDTVVDAILEDTGTTLPATLAGLSTLTAQQVWEYVTRTITSGGVTAQQVWEYATRALTDKAGFSGTATNMVDISTLDTLLDALTAAVAGLPANLDDEIDALTVALAAVKAKTDALGSAVVTVTAPVADSGTITLYQSDDYLSAQARAVTVTVTDASHVLALDNALAVVKLKSSQATFTATSVTSTAGGYTVTFEPTHTDTAALTASRQEYELEAVLADGAVVTLATGILLTVKDIPSV